MSCAYLDSNCVCRCFTSDQKGLKLVAKLSTNKTMTAAAAYTTAASTAASIAAASSVAAAVVHSLIWFKLECCVTAYLQRMFNSLQ